jgi:tetratricopeptide (TPR) repeat protein
VKRKTLGDNHPSTIKSIENMGLLYMNQRDYAHALECYSRALAARESAQSDDRVGLAGAYDSMGAVLYRRGEYAQSLEHFLKAAAIREQVQGNSSAATAQTYNSTAGAYGKLTDYAKALEYYQKAFDIIASLKGENSKEVVNIKKNILMTEYQLAMQKGKLKGFLSNHCFIGTVNNGDTPASAQGMSGEYVLLEFADWNQDSETSLFDRADEMRQSPKDIVVMKDGEISRHHFENKLGITFGVKQITKEEKQQINQAYKQWKEQNNQ